MKVYVVYGTYWGYEDDDTEARLDSVWSRKADAEARAKEINGNTIFRGYVEVGERTLDHCGDLTKG